MAFYNLCLCVFQPKACLVVFNILNKWEFSLCWASSGAVISCLPFSPSMPNIGQTTNESQTSCFPGEGGQNWAGVLEEQDMALDQILTLTLEQLGLCLPQARGSDVEAYNCSINTYRKGHTYLHTQRNCHRCWDSQVSFLTYKVRNCPSLELCLSLKAWWSFVTCCNPG